ncbi:YitT family protein [Haloimpatiens sp. FM7330]|uniref:YitT family protein n=1 Tax=Haloimpatiens sp. FM7330 TaxID=3298610 RepID=UPI003635FB04
MDKKNITQRIFWIILGSIIYAIGINVFIAPHKLLSGGIAGISLLCQYMTNVPSGYWVFGLNIPIFIIGYKKIDGDFIIFSLLAMVSMSVFLILTKDLSQYIVINDIVISTVFGAIINGLGMGLIFKNRASLGGTDIVAVIIRNINGAEMSKLYFAINGIVVFLGVFVTSLQKTLYTVALMYIISIVIGKVIKGFDQNEIVMIVTEKEKEVSKAIMDQTGRATTYLYAEGGYSGDKRKVIYCLLTMKEVNSAKKIIEEIDSQALISVSQAQEVQGKGFLKPAL